MVVAYGGDKLGERTGTRRKRERERERGAGEKERRRRRGGRIAVYGGSGVDSDTMVCGVVGWGFRWVFRNSGEFSFFICYFLSFRSPPSNNITRVFIFVY
ncbi:hypothetical protein HanRHA438_Chr07g0323911 [Helianthus annuus]|nr:hypothetical protein HanRHA438_Chr07g0323911 [Helianthus annuus]